MASELAEQIGKHTSSPFVDTVDELLAPVREVLEGLRRSNGCWCKWPEVSHTPACLAAQRLWEQLQTKG